MTSADIRRFAAIAIAASILDVASTYLALRRALGSEINPIAAHGMRVLGVGPLILLDLGVRVALVGALVWAVRSAVHPAARVAAVAVFITAATFWTLVVLSNASTIVIAGA